VTSTMFEQTTLGDHGLRVLAKVDGNLGPAAIDAISPYEGDEPYFPDYVDANFPRNQEITEEVVEATDGYAVADEAGNIIARFEGERNGKSAYQRAQEAVAGAKVSLAVDFDPGDEAVTEDPTPEKADEKSAPAKEAK
jgi:hypothetical protein